MFLMLLMIVEPFQDNIQQKQRKTLQHKTLEYNL